MSGTWILVVLVKLKFLVLSCVVLSCMVWYSIVFQSIPLRYSSTMGGVVRCCSPLFDIVLHPLSPRPPRLGSSRFRFDAINRHVCLLAWLLAYVVESLGIMGIMEIVVGSIPSLWFVEIDPRLWSGRLQYVPGTRVVEIYYQLPIEH